MFASRHHRRSLVLIACAATALATALAGCSGKSAAPAATVTVTSVSVSTVTVGAAATAALATTVTVTETAAPAPEESETTGAATTLAACTLVSKAEAEALAGTALNDPTEAAESCTYTGPVTGPLGQVEVYVGDGAKKFLDIERTLQHELRPLSGVGDEAYLGDSTGFVRRGFTWAAVHLVRLNDPAENAGPLEALVRKVADRLQ